MEEQKNPDRDGYLIKPGRNRKAKKSWKKQKKKKDKGNSHARQTVESGPGAKETELQPKHGL